MSQKAIYASIIVLIILVGGMFTFYFINKPAEPIVNDNTQAEIDDEITLPFAGIERINAKHFFSDGKHTFVGELPMPTPCDLLDVTALVAESFPEQVTLDFKVINNSEVCTQVITPQRFMVSVEASEGATFSARLMSSPVELNLLQPEEGETPEEFELFIKG